MKCILYKAYFLAVSTNVNALRQCNPILHLTRERGER